MLQLSAAEARLRVERAALVGTGRTLTGEVLPPRLSATAAAAVITQALGALPASVPEPAQQQAEATLIGYARDFDPTAPNRRRSSECPGPQRAVVTGTTTRSAANGPSTRNASRTSPSTPDRLG
jgi:hypothetical protein